MLTTRFPSPNSKQWCSMLCDLQQQHKEWVDREYPEQTPDIPAAGMVEEAGELLHAVLKLRQLELFGADARYTAPKLREALVDAIGDCAIYAVSFCNSIGWEFNTYLSLRAKGDSLMELAIALVRGACDHAIQKPYMRIYLANYLAILQRIAVVAELNFEPCVMNTWERVRLRCRSCE